MYIFIYMYIYIYIYICCSPQPPRPPPPGGRGGWGLEGPAPSRIAYVFAKEYHMQYDMLWQSKR